MTKKRKAQMNEHKMKMKQTRRKKKTGSDFYVASDPLPEEERNPHKFDRVPEEEEDELKDEEIDEDLAFTAEDELQFAHLFEKPLKEKPESIYEKDEMDELFGSGNEEEEEEEELIEVLSEDGSEDKLKSTILRQQNSSSHKNSKIQSESRPENILNMTTETDAGGQVASLTSGVGEMRTALKDVHKSLDVLESQPPLNAPLPRIIHERQIRKAGYAKTIEHISKWDDIVYANRMAPTLDFAPPSVGIKSSCTLEELVEDFQPESQMEKDIATMLEKAGASTPESIVKLEDELALQQMTLEDLKKKRDNLAKMRSLLFQHEMKSRQIKKIKSKQYHRRLQRSIRKKALRYGHLENEEAAKKMLEEMEYNRMKERLTQKHSTMNRFARRIMRRGWGVADENTKQALEEQLRQNQELKQKIQSTEKNNSEEENSSELSESDDDTQPSYKKTRKLLTKILNEDMDVDSAPKSGVLGLPFMQKALKKQQTENKEEAEKMMQSLDGEKVEEKTNGGSAARRTFGGNKGKDIQHETSIDSQLEHLEEHQENAEEEIKQVGSSVASRSFLFNKNTASNHQEDVEEPSPVSVQEVKASEPLKGDAVKGDKSKTTTSQEELIRLAFADDDIEDLDKSQEIEKELPKLEEVSLLPGWGKWKDEQKEPKWMQEKRQQNQKLIEEAVSKRKDFNKKRVFISEKVDTNLEKYHISSIPQKFYSSTEYEATLQRPIGPDCNTILAFEDFTRPKVLKRQGVIIEPLKLNQNAKDIREDVQEVKEGIVKVRQLLGGEIQPQVLLETISKTQA